MMALLSGAVLLSCMKLCLAADTDMLESFLQNTYPATIETTVTITNLWINYIDAHAFVNYTFLNRLKIDHSNLSSYSGDTFRGPPLQRLTINYTPLTHIPALVNYSILTFANFAHNSISTVDRDTFTGTPLIELRLESNLLTCLPDLGHMATLNILWMDGNDLSHCETPHGTLNQVKYLYINYITTANMSEIYSLTPNVQHLRMGYCALTKMPSPLPVWLRTLTLWQNQLSEIEPGLLATLPDLYTLQLDNNEFEEIKPYWLLGSAIRYLKLGNNELKCIPDLREIRTSLYEVDLSHNDIGDCDLSTGTYTLLTRLTIERNHLRQLPSLVYRAPRLQYLRLAGNNIYAIPKLTTIVPSLLELDLMWNPFLCACVHRWLKENWIQVVTYSLYSCPPGNSLHGRQWQSITPSELCQDDDCNPDGTSSLTHGAGTFFARCHPEVSIQASPVSSAEGVTVLECARTTRRQMGGGLYYNQATGQCETYLSPVVNQTADTQWEFYQIN